LGIKLGTTGTHNAHPFQNILLKIYLSIYIHRISVRYQVDNIDTVVLWVDLF